MRKKEKLMSGWNLALMALCVALSLVLAGFLIWDYQARAAEGKRLRELAGGEQEIYVPKETETAGSGEDADGAETPDDGTLPDAGTQGTAGSADGELAEGIVCWGDEFFQEEDEVGQYSYRVTLQERLLENGHDIKVTGKTLSGASTLSVMKMAGIPEEEIEAYAKAHREAAGDEEPPITETGTRSLTEEQMERTDADDIPVIFMGYYGGWNHDPKELIEQQRKILDTFGKNKERFLIVGTRPLDDSVSESDYDSAMEEAWGEHYLSAAEATSRHVAGRVGQAEIGRAIYEKLVDLGYITSGQE